MLDNLSVRRTGRRILIGESNRWSLGALLTSIFSLLVFTVWLYYLYMVDNLQISLLTVLFWVSIAVWTVVSPTVSAYNNNGLLPCVLLASGGPAAVGVATALSPYFFGRTTGLADVANAGLELVVLLGLPIAFVTFTAGNTASYLKTSTDDNERSTYTHVASMWVGSLGLCLLLLYKLASEPVESIVESTIDQTILVTALVVVGSVIFLTISRRETLPS